MVGRFERHIPRRNAGGYPIEVFMVIAAIVVVAVLGVLVVQVSELTARIRELKAQVVDLNEACRYQTNRYE